MKKKEKLKLKELKLTSFVTRLRMDKDLTIKGGAMSDPQIPETIVTPCDGTDDDEPTGVGASCEWTACNSHECTTAV